MLTIGPVGFLFCYKGAILLNSMSEQKKTGIFYVKGPPGVAVMWQGREMYRYRSVEELVQAHVKAVRALEAVQGEKIENLIAGQYGPGNPM